MAQARTIVEIIDADGCLYNAARYFPLLLWLCSVYGAVDLAKKFPNKQALLVEIERELKTMAESDFDEIDFMRFHKHCAHLQRQHTFAMHARKISEYDDLGVDTNDSEVQAEIARLFPLTYSDQEYALIYCKSCIEKFNHYDRLILNKLCEYANLPLIARMNLNSKLCQHYYTGVGSLRQGYGHDVAGMRMNGTNSIFADIPHIASVVGAQFHPLTLCDIQHSLPVGESLRRMMTKLNGSYHSYFCDTSKVLILYSFIHDMVASDEAAKYYFNFYDNETPLIHHLVAVFSLFPDLIPKGVTLSLIAYDGHFGARYEVMGTGILDRNYVKTNELLLLSAINNAPQSDKESISVADYADFKEILAMRIVSPPPKQVLAVGVDGRDCLYNRRFVKLLRCVLADFGKQIDELMRQEEVCSLKSDFSQKILPAISLLSVTELNYSPDWYKGLHIVDNDIYSARHRSRHPIKKRFAIQCQYLRHLYHIDPHIVAKMVLLANTELFDRIIASAEQKQCQAVELYNFSSCQSLGDDVQQSIHFGIGLMNRDLPAIVPLLNAYYQRTQIKFSHNPFRMSDLYMRHQPGVTLHHEAGFWLRDHSLLSVLYACSHHAVHALSPAVAFECYSQNIGMLDVLHQCLGTANNNRMLPNGLPVCLISYEGRFREAGVCYEIMGAGDVDLALYDSTQLLMDMCCVDLSDSASRFAIDMVVELNITDFLRDRPSARSVMLRQFENSITLDESIRNARQLSFFSATSTDAVNRSSHLMIRPPYY